MVFGSRCAFQGSFCFSYIYFFHSRIVLSLSVWPMPSIRQINSASSWIWWTVSKPWEVWIHCKTLPWCCLFVFSWCFILACVAPDRLAIWVFQVTKFLLKFKETFYSSIFSSTSFKNVDCHCPLALPVSPQEVAFSRKDFHKIVKIQWNLIFWNATGLDV